MTYEEQRVARQREQEERQRKIEAELDELERTTSEDDLKKRFFKDFGCINFQSDEFFHELNLARRYHARQEKKHPKEHRLEFTEPFRCYHQTKCTCGYAEACDSSD